MPWGTKEEMDDFPSTSNGDSMPVPSSVVKSNCTKDQMKIGAGGDGQSSTASSLRCGLGFCAFNWLQKLHTVQWLLAILCICAFNQSFAINAIFPVGLSTLEKRFDLSSTQTGIISSWYDFAVLLAVFPVCYYGNYGHKGRWISIGSLIMALGSAACTLPHFVSSPLTVDKSMMETNNEFGLCTTFRNISRPKCASSSFSALSSPFTAPFLLFLLGQTLHGFGATPLFSLSTAYLDENVSQKSSPVYLAIHSLLTSIGPVIGLFVGGKLLTIHEDFDRANMDRLAIKDSQDPRWAGACGLPFQMFARELPEAKKRREIEMHTVTKMDANDEFLRRKKMRIWSTDILHILNSPTFVAIIFVGIFESIVLNGFSAFMPKILEIILNTTPTIGAYLSSVVIFGAAGGVMIGGILIRNLRLQVGGMLKTVLLCHLAALSLIFCMLVQCAPRQLVGVNVGYDHNPSPNPLLANPCNSECHCNTKLSPVCDRNSGKTYYSACYAGCTLREEVSGTGTFWANCRCLRNVSLPISANFSSDHRLVNGFCPVDCGWTLWLFLSLLFLSVVASFAAGIPTQQIMLRVIPLQQRTLGIAVNWTFLRLFGFIPGGVLFGYMIDTTCIKWQESSCGKKLSCQLYDTRKLSGTIMTIAITCKLVTILATIIGYFAYTPNELDRGPLSVTVNDDRTAPRTTAHTNANSTDSTASMADGTF